MDEKVKNDNRNARQALAILFAFIMGLTVGNIDKDALLNIKDKPSDSNETSLINRDNTTILHSHSADIETTVTVSSKEEASSVTDEENFTVYRTPTGKKYHYEPYCAGVNRIASDLDEAAAFGLDPCKKCANG